MRTIRGLQITSLVVLSPVLICLIALASIIFVPIYSYILSWCQPALPELNVFHSSLSSIITWLLTLLIIYCTAIKVNFSSTVASDLISPPESMPDPFETEENRIQKKQTKKRKIKKNKQQPVKTKKKDELQVNKQGNNIKKESKEQDNKIPEQVKRIVEEEEEEDQWINVQKKKNQYFVTPEKKLTINKDNSHHLIISPDTTPHQSEDETSNIRRKGWYSPFSTGLDLDILPKFTMDPLCQYKINFTPPSSPLIPNLLEKNQHQQPSSPKQSRIELLENHPFISTTHSHHQHNTLGPIGEKPKYSLK